MSLYVTLPSNTSSSHYPKNTLNDFRIKLHSPLHLEGPYEVSLEEIQYAKNWYNVGETMCNVTLTILYSSIELTIPAGYYATGKALVKQLDASIFKGINQLYKNFPDVRTYVDNLAVPHEEHGLCKVYYETVNRRTTFVLKPNVKIELNVDLTSMLGFESNIIISSKARLPYNPSESDVERCNKKENHEGSYAIDLEGGLHAMYIYTGIVEPQVVGEVLVPLLRVVPIEGQHGERVTKTWLNSQYIPVRKNHFQDIHIIIRDGMGKPIAFESGRVILTLHFRRRTEF